MVDTVRTRSALEALLADNTSGDISPQDVRDFLASTGVYSSGSGAPGSAPASLFERYLDTTNKVWYMATGTSTAADWRRITPGWQLISTVSPTSSATVDFTGLAGYTDLFLMCRSVTGSSGSFRGLQVSVDNGSNWYTSSGNYISIDTAGVETNTSLFDGVTTSSGSARSFAYMLRGAGVNGTYKQCLATIGQERWFIASTSPINALRYLHQSGGNVNGGTLYLLGR